MTYADDALDLDALLPNLHRLDRRLAAFEAAADRLGPGDPELADTIPSLEALDRRVCQFTARMGQLLRRLQRFADEECDPDAPHLKRRLPAVMKTLSLPGEASAMLSAFSRAYASGPAAVSRLAQRLRRSGRLD